MVSGKKLSRKRLTPAEIGGRLATLEGWRLEDGFLKTSHKSGSFSKGVELINKIAVVADELDHHPDILLTYPKLEISLKTHDIDGITEFDFELAGRINEIVRQIAEG